MLIPENIEMQHAQQPMPEQLDMAEAAEKKTDKELNAKNKKRWAEFRQRSEACKHYRKKLLRNWTTNIDYRRGKPFASQTDGDDSVSINLDWSYTKTKQAALFSQVPKVRVAHHPESVMAGPWVNTFERKLNDTLVTAGIEAAMDEILPDCINAAGVGVVLASYESITVQKEVPAIDLSIFPPEIVEQALQSGMLFGEPIPMTTVPEKMDARYTVRRISPADFLWPIDFTGSDFDNAPWLGYSSRITWAEAMKRFNLTEEDKDKVQTEEKTVEDRLSHDYDREKLADDGKVGFDEIWYHAFQYNDEIQNFSEIHHLVFLHGRTEPVIDEPWKGQIPDPQQPGKFIGATKKPIRVLTLTYITDEDIPPSDSAIARSQVNELNKGRNHIAKQRARNAPITWFDVNRLDPSIQQVLMRGGWLNSIPVQGDGSRILGAVAQPAMHQENFLFDKIAKQDAQDAWAIGSNQLGSGGEVETKGEAGVIEQHFQNRIGRERAKTASMFVGIAEVIGGFMCIYEDPALFGEGFDPTISTKLEYSILADSTVLIDSQKRLGDLNNFVNTYAKTGWINLEPVLKEIATLVGLDPTTVVVKPQPQQPEMPNISLRLTGGEDMMNPLLLAFMIKTGQAPDPQLIAQAKELIGQSIQLPNPAEQQVQGQPLPGMPPPAIGEANPQATALPKITQRSDDPAGEIQ